MDQLQQPRNPPPRTGPLLSSSGLRQLVGAILSMKNGGGYTKNGGGNNTVIQTIYDDKEEQRNSTSGGRNAKLLKLAQEVERMSEVFEEANRARAEERQLREDMHNDLLRRIQLVRDYMGTETKRLSELMKDFTSKFEKDLQDVKDELMTKLNTKISVANQSLSRLENWSSELDRAIEQERQDRLRETEAVMAPIRKKVARVEEDLVLEQKIRQVRSEELMKDLIEATDSLNNTLDVDKFNREQYFKDLVLVTEDERKSLEKRQIVTREETSQGMDKRREALNQETENRIENQDGIVDNVTLFIKRFQENITEEGKMG